MGIKKRLKYIIFWNGESIEELLVVGEPNHMLGQRKIDHNSIFLGPSFMLFSNRGREILLQETRSSYYNL
jgi:hypothetical protein